MSWRASPLQVIIMFEALVETIAYEVLAAGDSLERRDVLTKWRAGAGRVGRPEVLEEVLPQVLDYLSQLLEAEANSAERRRILTAIGQVQDRVSR